MLTTEFLTQFLPFADLNGQLLAEVTENVTLANASKGDIIFKRGKTLVDLYFLIEGEVDLINNEFGIEKVKAATPRQALPLNEVSPTIVSAIAKSSVKYFKVNSAWLERLISGAPLAEETLPVVDFFDLEGVGEMEVSDLTDSDDWMSCILQSPVFRRIPLPKLQELFARFEKIPVSCGEKIVKEGAQGDYFYVVAHGTCRITNRSGSVNAEIAAGGYFGEEALISNAPRNATVEATSDGLLKRLKSADFLELVKQPVLKFVDLSEVGEFGRPFKILDVRMPVEYRAMHFPESLNIPLSRLRAYLNELGHGTAYFISAEAGSRAEIAAYILCQAGFEAVILNAQPEPLPESLLKVS